MQSLTIALLSLGILALGSAVQYPRRPATFQSTIAEDGSHIPPVGLNVYALGQPLGIEETSQAAR